jgi:alpha-D-ribose 1-methylphosphonate 5-triphosphate diphosphatase
MTQPMILANATLVLPNETCRGAIKVEDGRITGIDPGKGVSKGAVDCEGDFLAPGLVELHTDNLERHLTPRPGVRWPAEAALLAHDAELAGTGITTVFDAMRVGFFETGVVSTRPYARTTANTLWSLRDAGALKISHFLHLRAEVCSDTVLDELKDFEHEDRVGIVSLMDHTPGQRQFTDISQYRTYMRGKYGMSAQEFDTHIVARKALGERVRKPHEAAVVATAGRLGATLASHDDTTREHVAKSASYGIRLAEFPTTRAAAEACREAGIAVMMGAPNLVRGGSHSGNVSAAELADAGLLDIISSDYVPAALLQAAVRLGALWGDMARGLQGVTSTPARAAGLEDRGRIEPGARADLIRFGQHGDHPVLRGVWSQGRRVA